MRETAPPMYLACRCAPIRPCDRSGEVPSTFFALFHSQVKKLKVVGDFFSELVSLRGDKGARSIIERHPEALTLVRTSSKRALSDVDTRRDLAAARRLLKA